MFQRIRGTASRHPCLTHTHTPLHKLSISIEARPRACLAWHTHTHTHTHQDFSCSVELTSNMASANATEAQFACRPCPTPFLRHPFAEPQLLTLALLVPPALTLTQTLTLTLTLPRDASPACNTARCRAGQRRRARQSAPRSRVLEGRRTGLHPAHEAATHQPLRGTCRQDQDSAPRGGRAESSPVQLRASGPAHRRDSNPLPRDCGPSVRRRQSACEQRVWPSKPWLFWDIVRTEITNGAREFEVEVTLVVWNAGPPRPTPNLHVHAYFCEGALTLALVAPP